MNHLQIYKHVQENNQKYSYELRSMMRALHTETDLQKVRNEIEILTKFIDAKIQDEQKANLAFDNEQLSRFLLPVCNGDFDND